MFNLKRIFSRETNTIGSEDTQEVEARIEAQESATVVKGTKRGRGRPKGSKDTKPRKAYTKKANATS